MLWDTEKGWLYCLANKDGTKWGNTSTFHDYVGPTQAEVDQGWFVISSEVWGKLQRKGFKPEPGDGFAFYHGTRAGYSPADPYKRVPRISLIGTIRDIERADQKVVRIEIMVNVDVFYCLRHNPVLRDGSTRDIFEACGIKRGAVASMYEASATSWRSILTLVGDRLRATN